MLINLHPECFTRIFLEKIAFSYDYEMCGAGLHSRLVRSREFCATGTEVASTFVHSTAK